MTMMTTPGFLMESAIIFVMILGIWLFRSPRSARYGNLSAVGALSGALLLVLWRDGCVFPGIVSMSMLGGGLIGYIIAVRVTMIHMPAMIAFQHGAGGIAAFLISFVELTRMTGSIAAFSRISGFLGLLIGAATFSASMVASGKLAGKIRQTPVEIPGHTPLLAALFVLIVIAGILAWSDRLILFWCLTLIALAVIWGVIFAMRIGGADMPVLISFLNATAGCAAAFCGSAIDSGLLVACGATVAASGSVLTIIMCRAMNRGIGGIFLGTTNRGAASPVVKKAAGGFPEKASEKQQDPLQRAGDALRQASSIIIIPGYGMALAQAQTSVAELARRLEGLGKQVRFAIHPVAGRMPGHMNVLLAEVDVAYDKLFEMDAVNPEFRDTDLALIVGASDVVNPAAAEVEGTPISGMPILKAHDARTVVVCNLDDRPGYSGVPNTLYAEGKAILLFGDAKLSLQGLLDALTGEGSGSS